MLYHKVSIIFNNFINIVKFTLCTRNANKLEQNLDSTIQLFYGTNQSKSGIVLSKFCSSLIDFLNL